MARFFTGEVKVKKSSILAMAATMMMGAGAAHAETYVWSGPRNIVHIEMKDDVFRFMIDGTKVASSSICLNEYSYAYATDQHQTFVSMIMMAYASNYKVNIMVDDDSTLCYVPVSKLVVTKN